MGFAMASYIQVPLRPQLHSLKLAFSPGKNGGWKMKCPFGKAPQFKDS